MMYRPSDEELEIDDILTPWLASDESGNTYLKPDAPDNMKILYDKWMKKYIIPAREASKKGALFY